MGGPYILYIYVTFGEDICTGDVSQISCSSIMIYMRCSVLVLCNPQWSASNKSLGFLDIQAQSWTDLERTWLRSAADAVGLAPVHSGTIRSPWCSGPDIYTVPSSHLFTCVWVDRRPDEWWWVSQSRRLALELLFLHGCGLQGSVLLGPVGTSVLLYYCGNVQTSKDFFPCVI